MATEKDDPKAREKKDRRLEVRDLKPKKDVKGGAQQAGWVEKRAPGSNGEIDFMNLD